MSKGFKNPPLIGDKEYCQWKAEVDLWKSLTDLDKTKQGLALALSLEGKAREIAVSLSKEKLSAENGVDEIIKELDKLFEKDKIYRMHDVFLEFEKYSKSEDDSMLSYVVQFEHLYNKCKKFEMTLPDSVLALKLLYNANLTENEKQLALTACKDTTFDNMKNALK